VELEATESASGRLICSRYAAVLGAGLHFFPKGTDFSTIANAEVAKVERLLNARPRKSLGFRSPQEVFDSLAHS